MILGGALQRAGFVNDGPKFTIKGGVALEMRLKSQARATRDLDLVLASELQPIDAMTEALGDPYQGFSFSVSRAVHVMASGTHRIDVSLDYLGRPWGTVQVDVSPAEVEGTELELVDAIDLAPFGLEGPTSLPCLPLPYHVAQKLHAVTRPSSPDWKNDRFRDLVDLLLMKDWIEDYSVLVGPCKEVFATRATHDWPPLLTPEADWEAPYARLAGEMAVGAVDLHQAIVDIRHLITLIDETAPRWPSIAAPSGLTTTTWYYAVRSDNAVVRLSFAIGDGLLRDRSSTIPKLKEEWFKDPGGIVLIGVVVFLTDRNPSFVERVAVHPLAITPEAKGVHLAYGPPVWNSLAEDIVRRAKAPRRAMTGLSVFLSVNQGMLPATVGQQTGDSTQWMQKLWPELGLKEEPRLVWDFHGSTPVEFSPPRRPWQST